MKKALALLLPLTLLVSTMSCAEKNKTSEISETETMLNNLKADNIYIVCGHTDMRKSIDGLAGIVQQL